MGRPAAPSRNDDVTIACPVCGQGFRPAGRRRFCSDACRQAAWRQRHPAPVPAIPAAAPRPAIVYVCPACDARYLGQQRCDDCGTFCRRLGPGGSCPSCDEPVALADLLPIPAKGGAATTSR